MTMESTQDLIQTFSTAAQKVSAVVCQVSTMRQAFAYTVDLCEHKEACQLLIAGCQESLSAPAGDLCERKQQKKVMAAPQLSEEQFQHLEAQCQQRGIDLVCNGLRDHLAGIDIGFTLVDFGIAETGTLVIDSSREAVRLATMISEVHVAVLPKSQLRSTALDIEIELRERFASLPSYYAFITGASRTADIERVLALGVHGPLELHILLLDE
jgi:L-lactate dehydrogenase complex protein LldG